MYCSIDDIRLALTAMGEEAPDDELLRLAGQRASDIIDAYTGRHFRPEAQVEVAKPLDGTVLLDHWPIFSLIGVWDLEGREVPAVLVNPRIGELRVDGRDPVRVEYIYNDPDDPVPPEIKRACAWIAARLLAGPPGHIRRLRAGELALETVDWPTLPREIRLILLRHSHKRRFL